MERRVLLSQLAAGAAGLTLGQSLLAKNEAPASEAKSTALLDAALECHKTALSCQDHCIKILETKDTSMLTCFAQLSDLLALNEAAIKLFARTSKLSKDLAAVLKKSSDACASECAKHANHHEVCARCEKACIALSKAISTSYA